MLRLLLDEQISPELCEIIRRLRPSITVESVITRRLCGASDELLLGIAAEEGAILVTFDLATIPPILTAWAEAGRSYAGVIFIDERTFLPNNFSGIAHSLIRICDEMSGYDWSNRFVFASKP